MTESTDVINVLILSNQYNQQLRINNKEFLMNKMLINVTKEIDEASVILKNNNIGLLVIESDYFTVTNVKMIVSIMVPNVIVIITDLNHMEFNFKHMGIEKIMFSNINNITIMEECKKILNNSKHNTDQIIEDMKEQLFMLAQYTEAQDRRIIEHTSKLEDYGKKTVILRHTFEAILVSIKAIKQNNKLVLENLEAIKKSMQEMKNDDNSDIIESMTELKDKFEVIDEIIDTFSLIKKLLKKNSIRLLLASLLTILFGPSAAEVIDLLSKLPLTK